MEKLWIKYSVNPPPQDIDILVKLGDGTYAVGRKDRNGITMPANVHSIGFEAGVDFDAEPIAWQDI